MKTPTLIITLIALGLFIYAAIQELLLLASLFAFWFGVVGFMFFLLVLQDETDL